MGLSLFFLISGIIFTLFSLIFMINDEVDGTLIFLLIMGAIFTGIGVVGVKISNLGKREKVIIDNPERKEKAFQKWVSENLTEYNATIKDMEYLQTSRKYYILKPEIKKFIFIEYNPTYLDKIKQVKDDFSYTVVDLNNVRKISLKKDDIIIGEVTKDGGITRALVGGALFGTAGAIVGGLTAKENQTQTNKITSIKLEIITNDMNNPYSTIDLYSLVDEAESGVKTDFDKMEHTINNLYWSLENCLQQLQQAK